MDGETIPILKLCEPLKLVQLKENVVPHPILMDKNGNSMHAYLHMGTHHLLMNIHIFNNPCVEGNCDGLDMMDRSVCGCFKSAGTSRSKFCLCLHIKITPPSGMGDPYTVVNFTSKFHSLLLEI